MLLKRLNRSQKQEITPFQAKVYEALMKVPPGKVTTYKILASEIHCKNGSRAIGQALKRNPFAPEIPCHRVVRSDLSIGGYFGKTKGDEIDRKIRLLEKEGVKFIRNDKIVVVDGSCVHWF